MHFPKNLGYFRILDLDLDLDTQALVTTNRSSSLIGMARGSEKRDAEGVEGWSMGRGTPPI